MILVTGGAGFIGSHLVDRLLGRGAEILCVDDFNDFYDPAIKRFNIRDHLKSSRYHLVEADIRDTGAMSRTFATYPIDKVVHFAARAGVRPSIDQPLLYEDVNIKGTLGLLELARRPSEYVCGGRYFQSIEIPEGARLTNAVADLVGDDVLMYASDYPHGESHFPESAGIVIAWDMAEERKRKLLWDNAMRLYARAVVA